MRELTVVAALIKESDKVIICQRKDNDAYGLLWEFPGGTVKEGEALEDAIKREIKEELDIIIKPYRFIDKFTDENEDLRTIVHLFLCKIESGILKPLDCQDVKQASLKELSSFNLAPVDKKIYYHIKKLILPQERC